MNPKITLTNPTDDELNEAVAENVAGWVIVERKENGAMYGYTNRTPSYDEADCPPGLVPPFATSADAVLPLLYKTYWQVQQTTKAESPLRVRIGAEQDLSFGESDTFPRAACIALLRANGVEVVT